MQTIEETMRKKKIKNMSMTTLFTTLFVPVVKAPKSAHIYVKVGGGEPAMERGNFLQEPGDTAGFQWLPRDHCHSSSVAGYRTIKIY